MTPPEGNQPPPPPGGSGGWGWGQPPVQCNSKWNTQRYCYSLGYQMERMRSKPDTSWPGLRPTALQPVGRPNVQSYTWCSGAMWLPGTIFLLLWEWTNVTGMSWKGCFSEIMNLRLQETWPTNKTRCNRSREKLFRKSQFDNRWLLQGLSSRG